MLSWSCKVIRAAFSGYRPASWRNARALPAFLLLPGVPRRTRVD